MAYEKQTWATGDVITAEKLNHMENGIGESGYFECTISNVGIDWSCDKTISEILEAFKSGKNINCYMPENFTNGIFDGFYQYEENDDVYYGVSFLAFNLNNKKIYIIDYYEPDQTITVTEFN